jgi:HAD superfamily hydrolase (TIGR01458 family)
VSWLQGVRALLIDVDGTLLHGDDAIPGAAATIERLRRAEVPFRLTTNTTRRPRAAIAEALRAAGIDVAPGEVILPAFLARQRIVDSGATRAVLLVPAGATDDFAGVDALPATGPPDGSRPDWVVAGDLGPGWDFDTLNRAFRWLRDGAGFLALQRNPFWHAGDAGLVLDAGAFVAALEYAAGVEAEVVGKPAGSFFELALGVLGVAAAETMVVGDDLENDGRGPAAAGCRSVLVRTGKHDAGRLEESGFRPDLLLDSIADLIPA